MTRKLFIRSLCISVAAILVAVTASGTSIMAKKPIPGAMGNWNFDWRGKGNDNGSGIVSFQVVTTTTDGYTGTLAGTGTDNNGGSYQVSGAWTQMGKKLSGTLDLSGSIVRSGVPWSAKISGNGANMTMTLTDSGDKLKVKLDNHNT